MDDDAVDARAGDSPGDNRAELAELQAKLAEERFDALLAALPFGNTTISSDGVSLTWQDSDLERESSFAAPQDVIRVTLRRVDGTRAEMDQFKRGYRIGSWAEADATLLEWGRTAPEGVTQRVAYIVEVADGTRFYGTFPLAQQNVSLRSWVIKENDLDSAYLTAT